MVGFNEPEPSISQTHPESSVHHRSHIALLLDWRRPTCFISNGIENIRCQVNYHYESKEVIAGMEGSPVDRSSSASSLQTNLMWPFIGDEDLFIMENKRKPFSIFYWCQDQNKWQKSLFIHFFQITIPLCRMNRSWTWRRKMSKTVVRKNELTTHCRFKRGY